jgi:hypothetical protein
VSALPAREPAGRRAVPGSIAAAQWVQIRAAAPQATATIQRYLQLLAAFLAPASVNAAENALHQFARWMIADAGLDSIAAVRRDDIEDYKVWLAARPRAGGQAITAETHPGSGSVPYASSPGRVIEGDWPDAPPQPGHRRGHPEKARPAAQALLAHRKMEMTLIYARIANRVVADEYAQVSAKIDALYGQPPALPADYETTGMARLRREPTPACSATACAPAPPSWTAAWNQPARPAPTSAPAPSSCPSWPASATTPATTARPTGPPRSTGSSSTPKPDPPPPTPDGADFHAPAPPLDLSDAAELAETLTLLTQWLSGSQEHALAGSFAAFIGHPAYNTGTLCADLHRFAFLLGASDGDDLFGEPAP